MKQINELMQMSHASITSSDCQSTNSSWIQPSSSLQVNQVSIPSSLVAPKRQRRSTDHSKVVVKNYKKTANTESGAVLTHFKALSYKPQKRLRKKKKADPKLVDFLWRQIDSADIHAVSVFADCQQSSGWCCATNKYHSGHHHYACVNTKSTKKKSQDFMNPSSSSSTSGDEEGKKFRTSISIRELLL